LRVLDFSRVLAGPLCTMILGDMGADVIKVERPGAGDDARAWGPPFVDGASAWFASANRNKRSVALDLRVPAGRDVVGRLLDGADVFLQNTNPTKIQRLGIDPEAVRRRNPRLIYCALSGFGLTGPDAALPGYDLVAQARSGLMSVTGALDGSPQRVSTALSDVATGMCAALAVCAAAVRQARTGEGETIDVSLLDTDLALMAPRLAAFWAGEPEPRPSGGTDSVLALYQPFAAADGTLVIAVGNDAMWQRLCRLLGIDDLAEDPALADNAGRRQRRLEVTVRVAAVIATRSVADWLGALASVAVPAAPVQSLSAVVADPQVHARDALLPVPGSDLVSVHSPFRLESVREPRNDRFPEVGVHTAEVLAEAGLSPGEIESLVATGAVSLGQVVDHA
jgi:crotonobetainyl-CoA:carnitine CoA-transferase CaiB-like acyl-CoA transferase